MIRKCSLEEISDGRLYDTNDMVKAYCNDCIGCHACCENMGNSIILDPLDIFRLTEKTGKSFEELLADSLELNVVDGIIQPNIKMVHNACPYLDKDGRCSIHDARPGFCRMFPLGRYYTEDGFQYILQIHECERAGKTKIKVSKWLDTPNLAQYTSYINKWHRLLKTLQGKITEEYEQAKRINMMLLEIMYVGRYYEDRDFYQQFDKRCELIMENL